MYISNDFIKLKGLDDYKKCYIYLTIKQLYTSKDRNMNRSGVHSDGFMTDDINYIWYNEIPTIFYEGDFPDTPLDDELSIEYFESQKHKCKKTIFPNNMILRLDQFNIHETDTKSYFEGIRCFVKVSISKDKYDLLGNSKNPHITKYWTYRERKKLRNIPQIITKS